MHEALERFERPLVGYASRLLGGDVEGARDVVQEVFVRLVSASRPDVEARLGPWLFRVCRNLALDVRRKEARMGRLEEATASSRVDPASPPAEEVERRDLARHALARLGELPDEQREALTLKFQGGLSYREIAEVMGRSVGTVSWWIHEGMRTLRRLMERDGLLEVEA